MSSNNPDINDSTITNASLLIEKYNTLLPCKEYDTQPLINYRLLDKIFSDITDTNKKKFFIVDKRGNKYINFKMDNNFHLIHLNIETAKELIKILIQRFNWKRVDVSYSQTSKIIELTIYEYIDKDLLQDDLKPNQYLFTKSSDAYKLRYISIK